MSAGGGEVSGQQRRTELRGRPRVVVVGPCASGKTTLVKHLQAEGIDAHVSGQEHSSVRNLWRRLEPDVLVALNLDLATLRQRRHPTWPAALFGVQRARLKDAFELADIVIDTSEASPDEVFEAVWAVIARYRPSST